AQDRLIIQHLQLKLPDRQKFLLQPAGTIPHTKSRNMAAVYITSSQREAIDEMTSYFSEILGQVTNDVDSGLERASDRPSFQLLLGNHGGDPRAAANADTMRRMHAFIVVFYDKIKKRDTDGEESLCGRDMKAAASKHASGTKEELDAVRQFTGKAFQMIRRHYGIEEARVHMLEFANSAVYEMV
ncbi:hypothetical protein BDZ85DRAFT_307219, partial [Elsinoe ampelina]